MPKMIRSNGRFLNINETMSCVYSRPLLHQSSTFIRCFSSANSFAIRHAKKSVDSSSVVGNILESFTNTHQWKGLFDPTSSSSNNTQNTNTNTKNASLLSSLNNQTSDSLSVPELAAIDPSILAISKNVREWLEVDQTLDPFKRANIYPYEAFYREIYEYLNQDKFHHEVLFQTSEDWKNARFALGIAIELLENACMQRSSYVSALENQTEHAVAFEDQTDQEGMHDPPTLLESAFYTSNALLFDSCKTFAFALIKLISWKFIKFVDLGTLVYEITQKYHLKITPSFYFRILLIYVHAGEWSSILQVYEGLRWNIELTKLKSASFFEFPLLAALRLDKIDLALTIEDHLIDWEKLTGQTVRRPTLYRQILNLHARTSEWGTVLLNFMQLMEESGTVLNGHICLVIDCLSENQRWKELDLVLDIVFQQINAIDAFCLCSAIRALETRWGQEQLDAKYGNAAATRKQLYSLYLHILQHGISGHHDLSGVRFTVKAATAKTSSVLEVFLDPIYIRQPAHSIVYIIMSIARGLALDRLHDPLSSSTADLKGLIIPYRIRLFCPTRHTLQHCKSVLDLVFGIPVSQTSEDEISITVNNFCNWLQHGGGVHENQFWRWDFPAPPEAANSGTMINDSEVISRMLVSKLAGDTESSISMRTLLPTLSSYNDRRISIYPTVDVKTSIPVRLSTICDLTTLVAEVVSFLPNSTDCNGISRVNFEWNSEFLNRIDKIKNTLILHQFLVMPSPPRVVGDGHIVTDHQQPIFINLPSYLGALEAQHVVFLSVITFAHMFERRELPGPIFIKARCTLAFHRALSNFLLDAIGITAKSLDPSGYEKLGLDNLSSQQMDDIKELMMKSKMRRDETVLPSLYSSNVLYIDPMDMKQWIRVKEVNYKSWLNVRNELSSVTLLKIRNRSSNSFSFISKILVGAPILIYLWTVLTTTFSLDDAETNEQGQSWENLSDIPDPGDFSFK